MTEINPGMKGYGLTVFAGTRVDTFAVTVVGVQRKVRAQGSLLLIEVAGHGLEESSIAQGMSGSPIYLDGRFAGALAFGWGGSLRPIAGVTPAAEMLALPNDVPATSDQGRGDVGRELALLTQPAARGSGLAATLGFAEGIGTAPVQRASLRSGWPDATAMWRLLVTDLARDFPALGNEQGQWLLRPLGTPMAAASGGREPRSAGELVPGGSCAVPLVTGDAALGAIGTVTWVRDNQVLMMGHPFMQRGPVNLPLATAEVLTVLPSRQMSFKMGSIGDLVGTVHHDLRAGLSGRLGPAPTLIPVTVNITRNGKAPEVYQFAVADDPLLTATLTFWSIYNSLLVTGDDASLQTTRYSIRTDWAGPAAISGDPLVVGGLAAGPGGAAGMANEVMAPINVLLNNPHGGVRLKSVEATLEQSRSLQTARISGLVGPRTAVRAGDSFIVQAEVEPRRGERQDFSFAVRLPGRLAPGGYRLVLASAAELFALEAQRAPGRFQPEDLAGVVEVLRAGRAGDTLVLALLAPGGGTVVRGQEMSRLPPSVSRAVRAGNLQAERTLADYVWREEQVTPWLLSGHAVRSLRVQPAAQPIPEERRP